MASNEPAGLGLTRRELLLASSTVLLVASPWGRVLALPKGNSGVALRLHCNATRALAPFACAQAFVPGEIPAGSSVVSPQLALQSVVKNRWPDGSVKLALLAGHVDLVAGVERSITLQAGPALAGTALTEADLIASGLTATLAFAPFGSVELTSLIGVAAAYDAGLGRWSAGRVLEWYTGPESASWLYSAPIGSDAHLTAWFEVRVWRGGAVEVLAWIENGFLRVLGATLKPGTATLPMGAL